MTVFAIIPAYNEEKMIGAVVAKVIQFVDNVVVVDDGSTDSTATQASDHGAVVLRHIINRGQGAGLQTGMEYALKAGADVVVHFDADGQFEPNEIEILSQPVKDGQVDVVLGSRFLKDNHIPWLRGRLIKLAIWFTWFFSGIKLSDVHNGFRVFSREAASRIKITQNRSAHASQIIDQIAQYQLRYIEMPVTLHYTEYSQSRNDGVRNESNLKKMRVAIHFLLSKLMQ